MSPAPTAAEYLEKLRSWWHQEQQAAQQAQLEARCARPWDERRHDDHALAELTFARREQRRGARAVHWFRRHDRAPLSEHRIRSGYPALLWRAKKGAPADDAEAASESGVPEPRQRGVIVRVTANEIGLRLPTDYARFVEHGLLNLERESSEATFRRGDDAITTLNEKVTLVEQRALLFGDANPQFEAERQLRFRDEQLNAGQQQAVKRAAQAKNATLIVGPPGTGKTRTLVEVVRQALLRSERVLVTAASNVAVDNLARRLAAGGVKVLRLGAAHKVSADLAEHTLGRKMAALPEMAEAQALFDAAQLIADGKGRRLANPGKRISELRREAHATRDLARAKVMRRSRVVCATAGGVDAVPLGDASFDLVVLDEATQAPDPVALSALVRGKVMVMAGDPQQLPPTVVSQQADTHAGLSSTLFERCGQRWPDDASCLLTTQYRMSEELMRFPSQAHYDDKLVADASNRKHRLIDLLPAAAPKTAAPCERDLRPWIVIDTRSLAGEEAFDPISSSYHNEGHLALIVRELDRLIAQGIAPDDIAAICPYSAQVRRLRATQATRLEQGLEVGTVDGFQGREKEVVIVDLVRSNAAGRDGKGQLGFLEDVRRTNVAITRAKRQLIVIVDGATVAGHAYYRALLEAAEQAGALEVAAAAERVVKASRKRTRRKR